MSFLIHGVAVSPFVRKVLVAFEEKGVSYEQREFAPLPKTPELFAKHPLGKIPILEHDGNYIPDSSVICAYLDRLHPENPLYPTDPADFARALFLEEYADTRGVEVAGGIFFERMVKPNFLGGETALSEVYDPVRAFVREGTGDRRILITLSTAGGYRNQAWPPYRSETGEYAVTFRLTAVEFLVDLSPKSTLFPMLRDKANEFYGESGWTYLPIGD